MFEDLPQGFWETIQLDGRTSARCRRVCSKWKHRVDHVARLNHLISVHHVQLDKIEDLKKELGPLCIISQTKAANLLDEVLYRKYDINPHKLNLRKWSSVCLTVQTKNLVTPDSFFGAFGWHGEGGEYFINKKNGDIVLANNYYAFPTKDENPAKYDQMRYLEQYGVIWKLIDFPKKLVGPRYEVYKKDFHRGRCFYVALKNPYGPNPTKKPTYTAMLRKEIRLTKKRPRVELNQAEKELSQKKLK